MTIQSLTLGMRSENGEEGISAQQIVDITVPPIPTSGQERFENTESNEFRTVEFAEYAREKVGTPGSIGVAIDIIRVLSDDLHTFDQRGTRPGELEHHVEMIKQLQQILTETAESELETLDQPLFDEKVDEDQCEVEYPKEDTPSKKSYPDRAFRVAYIDRVSSAENIIAIPRDSPTKHFHVANGCIGQMCVVIDPREKFTTTTKISEKPVALPYSDISQAKSNIQHNSRYPLQEGELLQLPLSQFDGDKFSLSNREIPGIKISNDVDEKLEFELVRVTQISENTALGETVSKNDIPSNDRPNWISKGRKKAKRTRRKRGRWKSSKSIKLTKKRGRSRSNKSIKSTEGRKNLNKLLNGKL